MPTEVIVDVDPGGDGDYTTITAALAGEIKDLQAADENYIFRCKSGGSLGACSVIATWNPDATRNIVIEAAPLHEHNGTATTDGAAHIESVGVTLLNIILPHVTIRNLLVIHTTTGTSVDTCLLATGLTGAPTILLQNVFVKMPETTSTASCFSVRGSCKFVNCVGQGGANCWQTEVQSAGSECIVMNCTFAGGNRGMLINDSDGDTEIANTYSAGVNTAGILVNNGTASMSDVATNDGSGSAQYSGVLFSTANFIAVTDSGVYDPHLQDASDLHDGGFDVSAFNGGIETDYEEGVRTEGADWDIGADEFGSEREAPGGAAVQLIGKANPYATIYQTRLRTVARGFYS